MPKEYRFGFVIEGDSQSGAAALRKAKEGVDDLDTANKRGKNSTDAFRKSTDDNALSLASLADAITGVIGAYGISRLANNFAKTAIETDKLMGSLVTVTGGVESAGTAFDSLVSFAGKTPYTLDQSVNGFIKLKTLGLDPSERALNSYGNTAAAMGKDLSQMIEAVADASTNEFERLKTFGIISKQEGDNVTFTFQGVSTTVKKESGAIQEYLLKIGETKFGDAMANQMERLPGLVSNLEDGVDALYRKMGEAGGTDLMKAGIKGASSVIQFLTDHVGDLQSGLSYLKTGIEAVALVVVGRLIPAFAASVVSSAQMVLSLSAVEISLLSSAVASRGLSSALALFGGPAGATVIAVAGTAALIASIGALEEREASLRQEMGKLTAAQIENAMAAANVEAESIRSTIARLEATSKGYAAQNHAIEEQKNRLGDVNERLAQYQSALVKAQDKDLQHWIDVATEGYTGFATAVNKVGVALAQETPEQKKAREELEASVKKTQDYIDKLAEERAQITMSSREKALFNALIKAGSAATSEQQAFIIASTNALYDHTQAEKAAQIAAKDLEEAQKDLEKIYTQSGQAAVDAANNAKTAQRDAAEQSAKDWMAFRDSFSDSFADMVLDSSNFFDGIAKSFERMLLKMAGDLIASGVMDFLTGSSTGFSAKSLLNGAGTTGTLISGALTKFAPSVASSIGLSSVVGAGTTAAEQAYVAQMVAGGAVIPSAATVAGSGLFSGLGASLSAVAPWLAGAAAIYGLAGLDKGGTPTSNAGFLLHDVPGASAANKFNVGAFDSGFAPVGFALGQSQASASAIIDQFRPYDSALTTILHKAGITAQLTADALYANGFGTGIEGTGTGVYGGQAIESGLVTSRDIGSQVSSYIAAYVGSIKDQIGLDTYTSIISAGSADDMLSKAKELLAAQEDATSATAGYTAEQQALIDKLYPAQKQADEYAKSIEILTGAFGSSSDKMADAVSRLNALTYPTAQGDLKSFAEKTLQYYGGATDQAQKEILSKGASYGYNYLDTASTVGATSDQLRNLGYFVPDGYQTAADKKASEAAITSVNAVLTDVMDKINQGLNAIAFSTATTANTLIKATHNGDALRTVAG